LGCHFDE
jgi:peptidoglycan/LPS O-acetylase OafA/YrhL